LIDKVFGSSRSSKNKSVSKRTEALAGRISNDLTAMVKMTTKIETVVQKNQDSILTKPEVGGAGKAEKILGNMLSFMQKSREQDTQEFQTQSSFNEQNANSDADRHKEIMDVFIQATKKKREAEKEMAKESKKRKADVKKEEKKPEPVKKGEAPAKPAEAPAQPTTPAPKPAAPAKPAPTAKPVRTPATPTAPSAAVQTIKEGAKTAAKAGVIVAAATASQMGGNRGLVLDSLSEAGYSKAAQANIMANVDKESGFRPRSEEMPKPEKIFSMFGGPEVGKTKDGRPLNKSGNVVRFKTLEDVKNLSAEEYFNVVYGGRMGNTDAGDGNKYRGRGFIQITGKDMYAQVGKLIGIDLVGDPDLANKPEIAAKIVPAFFKLKLNKKIKIEDYNDINVVNQVVGSADVKSRQMRVELAASYADQINSLSTENTDIRKDLAQQSSGSTVVISQNTTNNQQKTVVVNPQRTEELNPTMRS
jgi:outer membrane biosynthesis protein TonB